MSVLVDLLSSLTIGEEEEFVEEWFVVFGVEDE